jgi:hypothetical protein
LISVVLFFLSKFNKSFCISSWKNRRNKDSNLKNVFTLIQSNSSFSYIQLLFWGLEECFSVKWFTPNRVLYKYPEEVCLYLQFSSVTKALNIVELYSNLMVLNSLNKVYFIGSTIIFKKPSKITLIIGIQCPQDFQFLIMELKFQ